MHGYHGRILNVNLSSGQVAIETFDETFARQYLGGNGFAIRLLYERLAAGIDPLAPDNMIVFAVGPTTDTTIPGATRCCAGTKSPLTGLFFDTTFGGMFAAAQKRSGFEAISITGRAAEPVYLLVHEDGAEIKPAGDSVGAVHAGNQHAPFARARGRATSRSAPSDRRAKTSCATPAPCIPGTKAATAWPGAAASAP